MFEFILNKWIKIHRGGSKSPKSLPHDSPISEHASPHNKYTIQKIIANESNKPFMATFRENHFWRFKIKCYDHHIISYMIDLVVISIKRRKLFVLWVFILTSIILGWFQDFEVFWLSKAIAVTTAFSLRQVYFALKLTRVFQTIELDCLMVFMILQHKIYRTNMGRSAEFVSFVSRSKMPVSIWKFYCVFIIEDQLSNGIRWLVWRLLRWFHVWWRGSGEDAGGVQWLWLRQWDGVRPDLSVGAGRELSLPHTGANRLHAGPAVPTVYHHQDSLCCRVLPYVS